MKTKFYGCIVLTVAVWLARPTVQQAQIFYTGSLGYTTNNGVATVYSCPAGALTRSIPATIFVNGTNLPVIGIGAGAFRNIETLTRVVITNSVASIGQCAFYGCSSLTQVAIGSGVTNIGYGAFSLCSSLGSLTVPSNVTSIGTAAFARCTSLTNITLGASVTNIGSLAFAFCTNLTSVTIPNAVSSISSDLFDFCTGLTNFMTSSNVTSIGDSAFWSCSSLVGVSIPNYVTNIENNAFWFCTSLTNVSIGNGVVGIGTNAFYWCPSLIGIDVDPLNPAFLSVDGTLFNKSQTMLVQYPIGKTGSYTVPNGVASLGDSAFSDSDNLTSVTIPESVTNIGVSTFEDCDSLMTLYFEGNAPNADATAFNYDTNVIVCYLPDKTGWSATFDGLSTSLWSPLQVQTDPNSLGVLTNQFGFNISGSSNLVVVIEGCTNLSGADWQSLQTNTLTGGTVYFSDPQWTNYPGRFYRISSP